ncbi:MAG: ABC transporter permease [Lachnospiraceae bacterium]|nr:ABC transporter permease [Lachnospiraceae bacterium]
MFWHNFKYTFLITLRSKDQIFWSLIFTVILGTLFYSTFGNAYEFEKLQSNIPVVVYLDDEEVQKNFCDMIEDISIVESGEKLLAVTYVDSFEEGKELLVDDTIGFFYSEDGMLKLMVNGNGIQESILSTIVANYHQIVTIMTDLSSKGPEAQMAAIEKLFSETSNNEGISLGNKANMDAYSDYFFNLIAMSCLFASFAGVAFTINNQANLSTIGARKNVSNTGGLTQLISGLCAIWILLSAMTCIAFGYLLLIGVNFGDEIPRIILTIFVGNMVGLTSGFFIGSIGKLSEGVKEAIAVAYSLISCFMSGLMLQMMKPMIHMYCPILEKINPAARLCDALYSLKVYETYDRFNENIITLLVMTVIFTLGGFLLGRRKQYASI